MHSTIQKYLLAVLLVGGLVLAVTQSSSAEVAIDTSSVEQAMRSETAQQAVELGTSEVLNLIQSSKGYAQSDPDRFFADVEALLSPLVDFRRFARSVMGAYAKKANSEQRARFAQAFKSGLVRTYAVALTEYSDGAPTILPPKRPPKNPDRVDVTQQIGVQGRKYSAIYRMHRKDGVWQLYNLVIEGVNIGINFRTQFASAMKDPKYGGDVDQVIDAWSNFIEEQATQEEGAGGDVSQTNGAEQGSHV